MSHTPVRTAHTQRFTLVADAVLLLVTVVFGLWACFTAPSAGFAGVGGFLLGGLASWVFLATPEARRAVNALPRRVTGALMVAVPALSDLTGILTEGTLTNDWQDPLLQVACCTALCLLAERFIRSRDWSAVVQGAVVTAALFLDVIHPPTSSLGLLVTVTALTLGSSATVAGVLTVIADARDVGPADDLRSSFAAIHARDVADAQRAQARREFQEQIANDRARRARNIAARREILRAMR